LIGGEAAVSETAVSIAITIKVAVVARRRPKATVVTARRRAEAAVVTNGRSALGVVTAAAAPQNIEGVSFRPVITVFNSHDSGSAVARIANQLLLSAAVKAREPKFGRIRRHRRGALEPPPLRGLAGEVPQVGAVAADFDFHGSVDHHFDGTFALIRTTASRNICPALEALRVERAPDRDYCNCCVYIFSAHSITPFKMRAPGGPLAEL
jgi:hypothetical protein